MSTSQIILEELRQGPRTTSELVEATGVSRNAVLCSLWTLNRDGGYTIANDVGGEVREGRDGRLFDFAPARGGHREGHFRLVFDPEHPTVRVCAWPGCSTHLNRYNPSAYCLGHRRGVARLFLRCVDTRLEHEEVIAGDAGQLVLSAHV